MSETREQWWEAQFSYEATTLDYLSPAWHDFKGDDGQPLTFDTEAEAEEFAKARQASSREGGGLGYVTCTRAKRARPETGFSDPFLEAEFAANRQYWAGRAEEARRVEANTPKRGRTVEVVRGRPKWKDSGEPVPHGTTGYVAWTGESQWGLRVGVKVEGNPDIFFTAASNVAVRTPEEASA